MRAPNLRPMVAADIEPASVALPPAAWGARRPF